MRNVHTQVNRDESLEMFRYYHKEQREKKKQHKIKIKNKNNDNATKLLSWS